MSWVTLWRNVLLSCMRKVWFSAQTSDLVKNCSNNNKKSKSMQFDCLCSDHCWFLPVHTSCLFFFSCYCDIISATLVYIYNVKLKVAFSQKLCSPPNLAQLLHAFTGHCHFIIFFVFAFFYPSICADFRGRHLCHLSRLPYPHLVSSSCLPYPI